MPSDSLVNVLSQQVLERIGPAIPRETPLALVDFPENTNCGEHAAWLGTGRLFTRLGVAPVYECSAHSYNRDELVAKLGGGTIVLHGGGLSDAGRFRREFRLKVLRDCPANRLVMLPQQIAEAEKPHLDEIAAALGSGRDVTLFGADRVSVEMMQAVFGSRARIELAPDMAFMLGELARPGAPGYDILWLARTDDPESNRRTEAAARLSSQAAQKFALPRFADAIEINFAGKHRPPTVLLTDWSSLFFESYDSRTAMRTLGFGAQSEIYVERARHVLAYGHVVITDRLRAHILCLAMGIPHVLVADALGKNQNFHESWTKESPITMLARKPAEAWTMGRHLAAEIKGPGGES